MHPERWRQGAVLDPAGESLKRNLGAEEFSRAREQDVGVHPRVAHRRRREGADDQDLSSNVRNFARQSLECSFFATATEQTTDDDRKEHGLAHPPDSLFGLELFSGEGVLVLAKLRGGDQPIGGELCVFGDDQGRGRADKQGDAPGPTVALAVEHAGEVMAGVDSVGEAAQPLPHP